MGNLILRSSYFSDGGEIPRRCGYKDENEQPTLTICGIPDEAVELALIMDDPDAMGAVGKVWVHWVVWNILPNQNDYATGFTHDEIENLEKHTNDNMEIIKEGMTDFGKAGYGGPAPPDKRHTYVFKVYALDCTLGGQGEDLDTTMPEFVDGNYPVTKAKVEEAMEGHIIEQVTLTGTYAP